MHDIFVKGVFINTFINGVGSKLKTYLKLKSNEGFEDYLDLKMNFEHRICLSRLRLSNHSLMIEKGRHQGIARGDRTCPFCPLSVENEKHFLLHCKNYSEMRNHLFNTACESIPHFDTLPEESQFFEFLTNSKFAKITGEYLFKAFYVRSFLLNKHKNQC